MLRSPAITTEATAPPSDDSFVAAARRLRLALEVVDVRLDEPRELYEASLAVIRPDQIVAWRGFDAGDAETVVAVAAGLPV